MKQSERVARSARLPRLLANDEVLFRMHRHWLVPVMRLAVSIPPLAFLTLTVAAAVGGQAAPGSVGVGAALALVLMGCGTATILGQWLAATLTLTRRHVIVETGLVRRVTTVVALETVQEVTTRQSLLGRLLDYGYLEIHCFGSGIDKHFGPVAHTHTVREQIFAAKSRLGAVSG